MSRLALVFCGLSLLACGGAGSTPAGPEVNGVALGDLDGTWCEEDPKVGCYTFAGTTVTEDALSNSKATKGTWRTEDDLLILSLDGDDWALQPTKRTATVLMLYEPERSIHYTFHKK